MLKKLSFLVLLVAGLLLTFTACSDDKTTEPVVTPDTPPGPTTGTLTTLTPAEQTTAATQTTQQVNSSIDMVYGNIGGMSGFGKYALNGKNPPTGWVAIGEGWYKDIDMSHGNKLFKVRLSPDIWLSANPDPDLITKFELKYSYDSTIVNPQYAMQNGFLWDMLTEWEDASETSVKGHNYMNMVLKMTVPQSPASGFDYSFSWNTIYDGVSTVANNESAHFTFTSTWPFRSDGEQGQVYWTAFAGEFKFDVNGAGILDASDLYLAGKVTSNGTLFIKYYNNGSTGWYKTAADNFLGQTTWYTK